MKHIFRTRDNILDILTSPSLFDKFIPPVHATLKRTAFKLMFSGKIFLSI